jgi:hypothetical protein
MNPSAANPDLYKLVASAYNLPSGVNPPIDSLDFDSVVVVAFTLLAFPNGDVDPPYRVSCHALHNPFWVRKKEKPN